MLITKTDIDFSQAFNPTTETVFSFFSKPGVGLYIPLYQREYSWDAENIDQMMEDLSQGVEMSLEREDSILFMGTVIIISERDPSQNLNPKDEKAIPTRVDIVIDGQQRISTFALLATLLHWRLGEISVKLEKSASKALLEAETLGEIKSLLQEIQNRRNALTRLFTVDLERGNPTKKPIIIRGSVDGWTFDGADEQNYHSDVAQHLARYIRSLELDGGKNFPWPENISYVSRNLKRIDDNLNEVLRAHIAKLDTYPAAWQLLQSLPEKTIWAYDRAKLKLIIDNRATPLTPLEQLLCTAVQILAFVYFLVNRCCFTVIRPVTESWAFDMFQSLNATGTPLTAVETFKPMVSNYCEIQGGFKGSEAERLFAVVDSYLSQADSANKKNTLTKEFLTTLALTQDGTKLSSRFSAQRRFLQNEYEICNNPTEREEFVRRMADLAQYRQAVANAGVNAESRLPGTEGASDIESELATFCIAYLKKSNHKMADAVLSRFFSAMIRADASTRPQKRDDFLAVCKALAAFYTLWRSATSNSGLDDDYRRVLRGQNKDGGDGLSWRGDPTNLTLANLKLHLRNALAGRDIGTKAMWLSRAEMELRYNNGVDQICRFALLIAAHDTIPDPNYDGLVVKGQKGIQPYLRLEKWLANDLSTIEHIAPQKPDDRTGWDINLYDEDAYHRIGNLTLLPTEINTSASNKGWREKCLYYKYLVVQNPLVDRPQIEQEALNFGVILKPDTIHRLESATHIAHIRPIATVGMNGNWNRCLVQDRSKLICGLLWDEIYTWLI